MNDIAPGGRHRNLVESSEGMVPTLLSARSFVDPAEIMTLALPRPNAQATAAWPLACIPLISGQ